MKINALQRDLALKQSNFRLHQDSTDRSKSKMGMIGQKQGINTDNSGNFTDKSEVAAVSFKGNLGTKVAKSNWFNWVLEKTEKHNVAASAFVALILAGFLRPLTIMSLPGKKDKDDKIYASGHSMASGIIGFGFSTLITTPLDDAISKLKKNPAKFSAEHLGKLKEIAKNGKTELERNIAARTVNALELSLKNIPDWIIAIPRATLTIALIPPILKYVFGVEKKKKPTQPNNQTVANNQNNKPTSIDYNSMQKTSLSDFAKGGKQ